MRDSGPGTAYPLIKAGRGLSGRFHGIHDGATIPLQFCSGSAAPSVRIDYRRHSVVATVQRSGPAVFGRESSSALWADEGVETCDALAVGH